MAVATVVFVGVAAVALAPGHGTEDLHLEGMRESDKVPPTTAWPHGDAELQVDAGTTTAPLLAENGESSLSERSYLDALEEAAQEVRTSADQVSSGLERTYTSVESGFSRMRSTMSRAHATLVQYYKDAPGRKDPEHVPLGANQGRLWLQLSVAATVLWGCWGLLGGVAQIAVPADTVFAWHCVGVVACAAAFSPLVGFALPPSQLGLSIASGAAYGAGAVNMIDALAAGGKVGVVVIISSMYPLITLFLNTLVLQERPTLREGFGCCIALGVILLMADGKHGPAPDKGAPPPPPQQRDVNWVAAAVCSLVGFGLWSFGAEVCSSNAGPSSMWQAFGCALASYPRLPADPPDWYAPLKLGTRVSPTAGVLSAVGMGLCMAGGTAAFMQACAYAPRLDPVVMMTSMYGLVTAVLSRIFLDNHLTWRQYLGVAMVPFAILLLQSGD